MTSLKGVLVHVIWRSELCLAAHLGEYWPHLEEAKQGYSASIAWDKIFHSDTLKRPDEKANYERCFHFYSANSMWACLSSSRKYWRQRWCTTRVGSLGFLSINCSLWHTSQYMTREEQIVSCN